jgi:hypothetical protein
MLLVRQSVAPAHMSAPLPWPAGAPRFDAFPTFFGSVFFGTSFGWLDWPLYRAHDLQLSMPRVDAYSLLISSVGILLSRTKTVGPKGTIDR